MDKQKIIKIVIASVIAVFAIVYYIFGNKTEDEYDDILTNNVVTQNVIQENKVEEEKVAMIKVYVTGEVNSPGVIELEEGARIEDAIEGAGGIKSEANLKDINLAYEVSDGEKVYIPNLSEVTEENTELSSSGSSLENTSSSNSKVNINKASSTELTSVPGIGASTAQKIVDYRNENGKFKTIEDIKNVSGIGDSKYSKIKDYICVK